KIPQLVRRVEDDALSRLLPDAGEARERMEVFPPDGAHHLPHRSLGENGQSRLGPDPRHLQQQGKQIPLNSVGKTVQGPAVLPDDRMRVQADAFPLIPQIGAGTHHPVTDSAFPDHQIMGSGPNHLAFHKFDHAHPPLSNLFNPVEWAWQMAMAKASAASSGFGTSDRDRSSRTISCTCRFSAWP